MDKRQDIKRASDVILTSIQRFSLHDGPGIRTTVFLKGCSLCCPWCSNPENRLSSIQHYVRDGVEGIYGKYMSPDELYTEIMRDKPFYAGDIVDFHITVHDQIDYLPGGVTFSGGECLLQMEQLVPLLTRLNEEHVHTVAETALYIPEKNLHLAIRHIDFFYVDVKILDKEFCRRIFHTDLETYLSNINILMKSGRPVVFRVPVIGGYTDDAGNRRKVIELTAAFAGKTNLLKVELMREHNLAVSKYQSLAACNAGFKVPEYKGVSDELMEMYKREFDTGLEGIVPVEICEI